MNGLVSKQVVRVNEASEYHHYHQMVKFCDYIAYIALYCFCYAIFVCKGACGCDVLKAKKII